jgi:GalNAc-alpha-(1->4)-GalNAc-alpha-(1->3)-diNAcBac-PP-undecaprenol alpha-1,4-N-acetyl-D-galactosaminyltransferase
LLALLGTKYPVYISDRGSPQRRYSKMSELIRKLLYRYARGIIAQTEMAAEMSNKIFRHPNLRVIGNPVELVSNHHSEREKIILSVGRLIATKHHDRLISIFARLHAPGWKLVIVGGDALKESNERRLRKIIEDNDLTDKVILAGELKNVKEFYLKSKIFAFTSSVEGFPNVIAEALSAGLPVVAYDCVAGPSEMIVNEKNGFLVPVFSDDLFVEKLQLLVNDNEVLKKLSGNANESVRKFSIDTIGQEFYSFLTDAH